jgi:hypothetical protein
MFHAQIMQAAGHFHDPIRNALFDIPQNIFDNATALDPRNRMFHPHSDAG